LLGRSLAPILSLVWLALTCIPWILHSEVTLDHKPSGSADELEDGGEEEEQEDEDEEEKGVDDSSDDDAFLNGTEALPEKKSSPPKPGKGVAAFDQVLNDDLKYLLGLDALLSFVLRFGDLDSESLGACLPSGI